MKVQRYNIGRSNVGMLEQGRAALRSPEAVAKEAAMPYQAVAGAAESIANDLNKVEQERQRIQALDDQQNIKIMDAKLKGVYANIVNDPVNKNQVQDDGTMTGESMLNAYEERIAEVTADLSQIQDPKTRARAEEVMNLTIDQNRVNMRNEVNQRSEAWHMKGQYDLREIALANEDWEMYAQVNNEILDAGFQTQAQYAAAEETVKTTRKKILVEDELAKLETDIAAGKGEEVLANQLAKPNSDPDVQDALVAGIKAQSYNYELSKQKEESTKVAWWMRETDNLINSIATEGKTVDIDSMFNTMIGTGLDPIKAATLANRVSSAQRSRTVKDDGYAIYKATVGMEPFDNSKANRAHTDRYVADQLEMNDQLPEDQRLRPIDVEISTYKATGLVGQRRQTRLESANTAVGLAESAEFWSSLHADPYLNIEDGLSGERRGIYEMITRRAKDGGMDWDAAALDVMDITKLDEIKKEIRQQEWTDDQGGKKGDKYYGQLMDDEAYDKSLIPFYGGVDNINHEENKARYRMYLQDGYTLTGNWEDARSHANEVFKEAHVLTNINGELEMQVGGIASTLSDGSKVDLNPLRDKFVEGIKGQKMMFTNVDGSTKLGTIDSVEGITLDDPKKIQGEYVYKVSNYGNRIVNPQTGLQLEVSFDDVDVYQLQAGQAQAWNENRFQEEQAQLQSDIDDLTARISFGEKVSKDMSAEERLLRGKEQLMMEKERQRR